MPGVHVRICQQATFTLIICTWSPRDLHRSAWEGFDVLALLLIAACIFPPRSRIEFPMFPSELCYLSGNMLWRSRSTTEVPPCETNLNARHQDSLRIDNMMFDLPLLFMHSRIPSPFSSVAELDTIHVSRQVIAEGSRKTLKTLLSPSELESLPESNLKPYEAPTRVSHVSLPRYLSSVTALRLPSNAHLTLSSKLNRVSRPQNHTGPGGHTSSCTRRAVSSGSVSGYEYGHGVGPRFGVRIHSDLGRYEDDQSS